jgi:hypothetical protein
MIGDCAADCLSDPPCCVGAEFKIAAVIKFLDRANQPNITF